MRKTKWINWTTCLGWRLSPPPRRQVLSFASLPFSHSISFHLIMFQSCAISLLSKASPGAATRVPHYSMLSGSRRQGNVIMEFRFQVGLRRKGAAWTTKSTVHSLSVSPYSKNMFEIVSIFFFKQLLTPTRSQLPFPAAAWGVLWLAVPSRPPCHYVHLPHAAAGGTWEICCPRASLHSRLSLSVCRFASCLHACLYNFLIVT